MLEYYSEIIKNMKLSSVLIQKFLHEYVQNLLLYLVIIYFSGPPLMIRSVQVGDFTRLLRIVNLLLLAGSITPFYFTVSEK